MRDKLSADLQSLKIDRGASVQYVAESRSSRAWKWVLLGVFLVGGGVAYKVVGVPKISGDFGISKDEVAITQVSQWSAAGPTSDLAASGYVIPQRGARVGSTINGRILKVHVTEGQQVKAGDLLFELDPSDQKSAISTGSARAQAAAARAAAAQAQVAELEGQLAVQRRLAASGSVPRASVEDMERRLSTLRASAAATMGEARAAGAEVKALGVGLAARNITAPLAGTVNSKPVQVGQVVQPDQLLVELADFSSLEAEVDVPEGRLGQVKVGAPAELTLDAYPGKRMRGEVASIGTRLDRAKGTVTVKVKFLEATTGVLPQMAVRVNFLSKPLSDEALTAVTKIVVPATAVVERNGSKVVFVVEGGKAKLMPVNIGPAAGAGFEVSGLAVGTRLVDHPSETLQDGASVKEAGAK